MLICAAGAFDIDTGIAVCIENLAITTAGRVPAISVRSGYGISLHDLFVAVVNPAAPASAVALSGVVFDLSIYNNWITAPFGIRALDSTAREPFSFLWTAGLRIENNLFVVRPTGDRLRRQRCAHAGHEHLLATRSQAVARRASP